MALGGELCQRSRWGSPDEGRAVLLPFTVRRSPSTVHRPPSIHTVHCPPSTVNRPPSTVHRPPLEPPNRRPTEYGKPALPSNRDLKAGSSVVVRQWMKVDPGCCPLHPPPSSYLIPPTATVCCMCLAALFLDEYGMCNYTWHSGSVVLHDFILLYFAHFIPCQSLREE